MAEVKKEEKKGLLGKLKEHAEDKEEQLAFLSTIVRLAVLTWSAGILTLNYVEIPGYVQEQKIDPTFIACLLYTSPSPRDGQISRMPSSA